MSHGSYTTTELYCVERATFFAERIINTWNSLPHDSIDFSSLHAFQRGIEENDFS